MKEESVMMSISHCIDDQCNGREPKNIEPLMYIDKKVLAMAGN